MGFHVTGLVELEAKLVLLQASVTGAAPRAAKRIGEDVLALSAERCPVDTGTLRATGHVEGPTAKGDKVDIVVGYGGPAAPYALPVHERLGVRHPVGQAKFLESAALEYEPRAMVMLAAIIKASTL